jgi:hypothetical protein
MSQRSYLSKVCLSAMRSFKVLRSVGSKTLLKRTRVPSSCAFSKKSRVDNGTHVLPLAGSKRRLKTAGTSRAADSPRPRRFYRCAAGNADSRSWHHYLYASSSPQYNVKTFCWYVYSKPISKISRHLKTIKGAWKRPRKSHSHYRMKGCGVCRVHDRVLIATEVRRNAC